MNPKIDFILEDPMDGSVEAVNANIEKLREDGIAPVNLFIGKAAQKPRKRFILMRF